MKLETERLILRDFVKDDWHAVLEYQTDRISKYKRLASNFNWQLC